MIRWLSFWALQVASAVSFDDLALFQVELRPRAELGVDQQDPLPQSNLMPGGMDTGAAIKAGSNMLDMVASFRNSSFWETLDSRMDMVVGLWLEAMANYSAEWRRLGQAGGEMEVRSAVAEAIIAFNESFQSLQEPITAVNEGLGDCHHFNGMTPSCDQSPGPVIRFMNYVFANKSAFLEDMRLNPSKFTASQFCGNITPLARGVSTVQIEVAAEMDNGAWANSEHGAKDPEMDPLVLMAPDVIAPWRRYRQRLAEKLGKMQSALRDNSEQWNEFATSLLSERTGCHMTKGSLSSIFNSAAHSRMPLGLFTLAVAGALWRSARQPPF